MKIGVPKETKNHEYRVGLTPGAVREVISHGHGVIVESGAGLGIGASDADYQQAGAELVGSAEAVFDAAEMIVKVKEPLPEESARLRPDHLLLTYLHLAANPALADELLERKITAIAYETVTAPGGGLPLLAPMSEVAGRMSIQAGAAALEKSRGGRGVLLGGVPGVEPGRVLVLGGGTVGNNAAHTAVGIGADVTVIDKSLAVLRHLDEIYGGRVKTLYATRDDIERLLMQADLVIGAVLIPGATAPKLVTRDMLARMKPGAVIVDVAIDQGGCFETSRPTTHADPTFVVDGVVHYCVANMPGAVARTATYALNAATLPYILTLADKGWKDALKDDAGLRAGLNVCNGQVTHPQVAASLGRKYLPAITQLA
ncbi:MAG: alanine dehydrogenase [Zoogloea sp.]|uniref:alanine dehydrogenase n=1 Tax=Zoogloea sp. TaxID=49181 RepID=UPI00261FA0DE|nr:alanine dehydrogenase [Zoogloea sp.]MDD3326914.1 alanine dehydrogenase [Zoogloea sp.]